MTLEQLLAKNPGLDPKAYIQEGQQIKIGGLFGGTQVLQSKLLQTPL
jgi:hypothetical protein